MPSPKKIEHPLLILATLTEVKEFEQQYSDGRTIIFDKPREKKQILFLVY